MIEIYIAIGIVVLTVLFLALKGSCSTKELPNKAEGPKTAQSTVPVVEKEEPLLEQYDESVIEKNNKNLLLSTFRELKSLKYSYIIDNGRYILACDEKKVMLASIGSPTERKIMSRSIDHDVICDVAYASKSRKVAVGLKNSKIVLFFNVEEVDNKTKLVKDESLTIETSHTYEIKHVVITSCGTFLATSGTNDDTSIQIYNLTTKKLIEKINMNEIRNNDIKFSRNEQILTVSTYMYEIGVILCKKDSKFNNTTGIEEFSMKFERQRSMSGFKVHILSYSYSNDNRYVIASCENGKIKVLNNSPPTYPFELEFGVNFKEIQKADKVSMFVSDYYHHKYRALIAVSNYNSVLVYKQDGTLVKVIQKAHDSEIIELELIPKFWENNENECVLLTCSRDGRLNTWALN